MIIFQGTNLKVGTQTASEFVITQPSSPLTKNVKTGETLDLEKHPNAIFSCTLDNPLIVTSTYACEFETDDNQYNFNAKVTNQVHTSNNKYNVTLQAVGKVTKGGKSDAPTISYDNTTFTVSASGQGEVKMYVDGVETVSPHTFDAVGTYVVTATAEQDGKAISDTVTENITIAKTATPTISYDSTTFTVSASGQGTVKMYVDGVETVSPHTFDAVGTYVVTATAIETGKFLSDTATENITIAKTATPTISYDDSTYTVSASGNGTVTMYVDGVATVSPHTFTQGQSAVTYTVTATAIETGKFLSDTATESCLVPAEQQADPLDSPLEISGALTSDVEGSYDSIVYSQETNDVYMRSAGMTYDSTNDRYVFASNVQLAFQEYRVPTTHTIETITFVNLDSTYKAELLQMGYMNYGTLSEDQSGNLVWTRTQVYNPNDGLSFDFTGIIETVGADMTCQKMILTLAEFVATPLYILGNVNGQSWGPNIGTEINFDSSQFMYTLTITAPANEAGTFSFSTQLASQGGQDGWEEISNYRYGAYRENYQVAEEFDDAPLEQNSTHYFEIQADTEYNISINSDLSNIYFEQVLPDEPGE